MPSGQSDSVELLQGALDLIVLRALHTMGPLHAYGLAARLEQVADHRFVSIRARSTRRSRLEQRGFIKGTWQKTESNRDAKFYRITKPGIRAVARQTQRWRRLAGLVEKLLLDES